MKKEAKWIRDARDLMEFFDQIRIDMVKRREDAERINAISRLYLKQRKRLRIDWQRN